MCLNTEHLIDVQQGEWRLSETHDSCEIYKKIAVIEISKHDVDPSIKTHKLFGAVEVHSNPNKRRTWAELMNLAPDVNSSSRTGL